MKRYNKQGIKQRLGLLQIYCNSKKSHCSCRREYGNCQASQFVSSSDLQNIGGGVARSGYGQGGSNNLHNLLMMWGRAPRIYQSCIGIFVCLSCSISVVICGNGQYGCAVCLGSTRRGDPVW